MTVQVARLPRDSNPPQPDSLVVGAIYEGPFHPAFEGHAAPQFAFTRSFEASLTATVAQIEEAIEQGLCDDVEELCIQGDLPAIPSNLKRLPKLRVAQVTELCGGSRVKRKAPFDLAPLWQAKQIEFLKLRLDDKTAELAPGLAELSQLRWLSIEGMALTTLPAEFDQLASLERLHLICKKLSALPPLPPSLRALDVRHGLFKDLPDLSALASLQSLHFRDGKLSKLADAIGKLGSLEEITVADCALSSLPSSVAGLRSLKKLHVTGKPLKKLPRDLGALAAIPTLFLSATRTATAALEGADAARVIARLKVVEG